MYIVGIHRIITRSDERPRAAPEALGVIFMMSQIIDPIQLTPHALETHPPQDTSYEPGLKR
jgi:hypothetical protein